MTDDTWAPIIADLGPWCTVITTYQCDVCERKRTESHESMCWAFEPEPPEAATVRWDVPDRCEACTRMIGYGLYAEEEA